jgi:hypothetical protein
MARRIRRVNHEWVASHCAWCEQRIEADSEVYSVGAKARSWVRLPQGKVIELSVDRTHKHVLAIVPTRDSPARQAGNDLLFATCSQACGEALKEGLQKQMDFEVVPPA